MIASRCPYRLALAASITASTRWASSAPGAKLGVRPPVPLKPGNSGGGKGPQFRTDAIRGEGPGDWATYQLRRVFKNCRWRRTRSKRREVLSESRMREICNL